LMREDHASRARPGSPDRASLGCCLGRRSVTSAIQAIARLFGSRKDLNRESAQSASVTGEETNVFVFRSRFWRPAERSNAAPLVSGRGGRSFRRAPSRSRAWPGPGPGLAGPGAVTWKWAKRRSARRGMRIASRARHARHRP
jgi:hypothetical protein